MAAWGSQITPGRSSLTYLPMYSRSVVSDTEQTVLGPTKRGGAARRTAQHSTGQGRGMHSVHIEAQLRLWSALLRKKLLDHIFYVYNAGHGGRPVY
jgi:hypothetical protein